MIMIQAAFQSSLPILYDFTGFSCLDILKLRAGISWKCGRALKPSVRSGTEPTLFDGWTAFYQLGLAQIERALWYWFIAGEGAEAIVDWTSLIYSQQGCDLPPAGQFQGILESWVYEPGAVVQQPIQGTPPHPSCVVVGFDFWTVLPGCECTVGYSLPVTPFGGQPLGQIASSIEDIDDGTVFSRVSVSGTDATDPKNGTLGISTKISGGLSGRRCAVIGREVGGSYCTGGPGTISFDTQGHAVTVRPGTCNPAHTGV
jgi:hypothetical protein